MFLDEFHFADGDKVRITAEQASRFAKEVAGDFNPLHNADSKRFCVPGDLLFSLVLAKCGISERMSFTFTGMVGDGVTLCFPDCDGSEFEVADEAGKSYLRVTREGELSHDADLIGRLARRYVEFSGQNFPHILVPLVAAKKVMINPDRPMVIYESMAFDLTRFDLQDIDLKLSNASFDVKGRRGDVQLVFDITSGGVIVGSGNKNLVLSGLREYDEAGVQRLMNDYESWRADYLASS